MPWYLFSRAGWQIAVDALHQVDALQHIKLHATGAEFKGQFNPPGMSSPSMATAMTTARRQAEIESRNLKAMNLGG